jgi:protein-S-isoprenylcysteine O-methyltransferase Ste14
MDRIDIIEVCALYLPVAFVAFCWRYFKPTAGATGALLLSFLWNLVAIFMINQVAFTLGWWSYVDVPFAYHDLPLSIWFGWAIAWGLAAPLVPFRGGVLLLFALIVDLLLMPSMAPLLTLNPGWVLGEFLALSLILLPGVLLYKWTIVNKFLRLRVALQGIIFFAFVGFLLPDLILNHAEGRSFFFAERHPFTRGLQMNLMFFWVVLGLSAVSEFIRHGEGTPIPYDSPRRIVRTGLYAYISNPMQLCTTGGLLTYAWILDSWGMICAAMMVVVYSLGIALPSEGVDLTKRFGDAWQRYIQGRKSFLLYPKPYPQEVPSVIHFGKNCKTCSFLSAWLRSKNTSGLVFKDAESFTGRRLTRLIYIQNGVSYEGVNAFARGISHIHLGWAVVACFICFPGISFVLQLIADADMFGETLQSEADAATKCK